MYHTENINIFAYLSMVIIYAIKRKIYMQTFGLSMILCGYEVATQFLFIGSHKITELALNRGAFNWKILSYVNSHLSDGAPGIKKHFKKGFVILS